MTAEAQEIMEKLDLIRSDLEYIKEHMVDVDTVLTPEEEGRLEESLRDLETGNTTSLEDFEKEIKRKVRR